MYKGSVSCSKRYGKAKQGGKKKDNTVSIATLNDINANHKGEEEKKKQATAPHETNRNRRTEQTTLKTYLRIRHYKHAYVVVTFKETIKRTTFF